MFAQQLLTKQKCIALSLTFSTFILPPLEIVTFPIPLIINHSLDFSKSCFCFSCVLFFHIFIKLWKFSCHPTRRELLSRYVRMYTHVFYLTNHTPSLFLIFIYQLQHHVEDESNCRKSAKI